MLEAPNVGLTVSTSSRFYTSVRCQPSASNAPAGTFIIVVESPQFHEGYEYLYDARDCQLTQRSAAGNGFVEKCLLMTLSFIKQHRGEAFLRQVEAMGRNGKCLCMRLCAHNDFYSQTARVSPPCPYPCALLLPSPPLFSLQRSLYVAHIIPPPVILSSSSNMTLSSWSSWDSR